MADTFIVDRRINPKGKSLGNRQRFIKRSREQIREAVKRSIAEQGIANTPVTEKIDVSKNSGTNEPRFVHSRTGGVREDVYPGNRDFIPGDRIPKPPSQEGGKGKRATDSGEGEDEFQFALTREEFLDIFFEDLALPDLVKTGLKEATTWRRVHAGITNDGSPANLNLIRTMRNSHARRIALKRPTSTVMLDIQNRVFELESKTSKTIEESEELRRLHIEFEEMQRKQKTVSFIDPTDLRYNHHTKRPEPNTQAVMFCLMDVSASMTQKEKELAKRFFILLHLFLERQYEKIELVFIRHTHKAKEVDEDTFFYGRESGGTIVSTALIEMRRVIGERYPSDEWNIYAAQASDGENWEGDSKRCVEILLEDLLPICQYYAYIEIVDQKELSFLTDQKLGGGLWSAYRTVLDSTEGGFAMNRIAGPEDIFPVFRELFEKR